MQEGFEKASMMKLDKIDETIKKIENFNEKYLSKYRIKETKSIEDTKDINNGIPINDKSPHGNNDRSKNSYSDGKNIKLYSFPFRKLV